MKRITVILGASWPPTVCWQMLASFMPVMPRDVVEKALELRERHGEVSIREYWHEGALVGYAFYMPECRSKLYTHWIMPEPRIYAELQDDARRWAQEMALAN